jgi:ribonuclease P protein component
VRLKIVKLKKGIDVVLMALPGIEKKDFWEIEEIVDNLFKKARIYNL